MVALVAGSDVPAHDCGPASLNVGEHALLLRGERRAIIRQERDGLTAKDVSNFQTWSARGRWGRKHRADTSSGGESANGLQL